MQRMCDDVPTFTDSSVTLVSGLIRKVFVMCAFSGADSQPLPYMLIVSMQELCCAANCAPVSGMQLGANKRDPSSTYLIPTCSIV